MVIMYVLIVFIAILFSAIAGLGGGVVIKPLLDMVSDFDPLNISFISSSAVFIMALYSSLLQYKKKNVEIDISVISLIAIGASLGGMLGSEIFEVLLSKLSGDYVTVIQSLLLILVLVIVLFIVNFVKKSFNVTNRFVVFIVGLILGTISSFIGIGGGPLNVCVFLFVFSYSMNKSVVYSIAVILFSQATKLVMTLILVDSALLDFNVLTYIVPTALIASIIGNHSKKYLDEKKVRLIYNSALFFVIVICMINIVGGL